MNTYEKLVLNIDRKEIQKKIDARYPNMASDEIELAVKEDIKNSSTMFEMIKSFDIDIEEFFIHMIGIFPDLMKKKVIQKRIRKNLKLIKENEH